MELGELGGLLGPWGRLRGHPGQGKSGNGVRRGWERSEWNKNGVRMK